MNAVTKTLAFIAKWGIGGIGLLVVALYLIFREKSVMNDIGLVMLGIWLGVWGWIIIRKLAGKEEVDKQEALLLKDLKTNDPGTYSIQDGKVMKL